MKTKFFLSTVLFLLPLLSPLASKANDGVGNASIPKVVSMKCENKERMKYSYVIMNYDFDKNSFKVEEFDNQDNYIGNWRFPKGCGTAKKTDECYIDDIPKKNVVKMYVRLGGGGAWHNEAFYSPSEQTLRLRYYDGELIPKDVNAGELIPSSKKVKFDVTLTCSPSELNAGDM